MRDGGRRTCKNRFKFSTIRPAKQASNNGIASGCPLDPGCCGARSRARRMLAGCGPETDDPRPARAPGDAGPGSGGSGIRRWCAGRSGSGSGTDPYAAVLPFYDVTRVDARRGTVRTVPRAAEARARRAGALPLRDSIGRTDAGSRGAAAVLAGCVPPPSAPAACVRCRGAGRRACPRGYRLPHPSTRARRCRVRIVW